MTDLPVVPTVSEPSTQTALGWREWVRLEELGLPDIRAKIDTGAKTSALHAFEVTTFEKNGEEWVRFLIHPRKSMPELVHTCEAKVIDTRNVKDSGGHKECRYVIKSPVCLGEWQWDIEMTLTDRDTMNFMMLIGREALAGRFLVDSAGSFLQGRPNLEKALNIEPAEPVYIGK